MQISTAGHKTICVPVASEADYQTLIRNGRTFRCFLDDRITLNCFQQRLLTVLVTRQRAPKETQPYHSTNQTGEHPSGYQMRPDFVLPVHGWPDEVEKKPCI